MKKNSSQRIAILGMFAAIIVVLQLLSYVVKIGTFNLSLVLIPIVLGSHLYGAKAGAILGGVFGVVVSICCVAGMDGGGFILFSASPILTVLVCVLKGTLAGAASGGISNLLKNKNKYLAILLSAIVAPIVNTGLFILALVFLFHDILVQWAGGQALVSYIILGLVGVNFLIELGINIIAAPSLLTVTKALKK